MDQQLWLALVTGLMGVLVLMFGAIIKRLFAKQDELEKSKANASSTDSRFTDMLSRFDAHVKEDRDMHRDVLSELSKTNTNLSQTNATLAGLAGRFDGYFSRQDNGQRDNS